MQPVTRRTLLALTASAAVAASTGAAIASPAPSELAFLIAACDAAKADYERLQNAVGDLEGEAVAVAATLPAEKRYFSPTELYPVLGSGWVNPLPLIDLATSRFENCAWQISDYVDSCVARETVQQGLDSLSGVACISNAFEGLGDRLAALDGTIRPRFADAEKSAIARMKGMHKALSGVTRKGELAKLEEAAFRAAQTYTAARVNVLACRPAHEAERAEKNAWLFAEYGDGANLLDEAEQTALLASLFPA